MSDTAIAVKAISKIYPLYQDPVDRLKESLHPLRKKYHKEFHALNNVSFTIKRGETLGIIGRNGSGKSTLLKILTGVLTPTSGMVSSSGKVLALLELGAGFNPELNGIENIYFNAALFGADKHEIDSKLEAILDFADIGEFAYQPVKTYSSGMVVRLAFAVIANMNAEILIIDEALSVGDAFFVQKCMRFLRDFIETGTLLFVSHDTSAVLSLCSRAIWLEGGKVKADSSPKDIAERYLASLVEENQGESRTTSTTPSLEEKESKKDARSYDMRLKYINTTQYRNDIELFDFKESSQSFGTGLVRIVNVALTQSNGRPLSWVVGGENVILKIECKTAEDVFSPIIGFYFKDRLGQILFGENTFNFNKIDPLEVKAHQKIVATFSFRMPILPPGDYSFTTAIAEGSQENAVQHHWIHDALILKSHSSSVTTGLVGIEMNDVTLTTL